MVEAVTVTPVVSWTWLVQDRVEDRVVVPRMSVAGWTMVLPRALVLGASLRAGVLVRVRALGRLTAAVARAVRALCPLKGTEIAALARGVRKVRWVLRKAQQ